MLTGGQGGLRTIAELGEEPIWSIFARLFLLFGVIYQGKQNEAEGKGGGGGAGGFLTLTAVLY